MDFGSLLLYGTLAVVVVGSAIGLLISRNAVYAALFLVLNFMAVGLLYLVLGAPFIGLIQVTVYAGSIMVLFMFVIMLLGAEQLPFGEPVRGQRVIGLVLAVAFLAEVALFIQLRSTPLGNIPPIPTDFATPAKIGMLLFDRYLLAFEVTAIILLAATVGAIMLTKQDKPLREAAIEPRLEERKE
jgi:NADH-quinone oxidoreductase subunit J